MPVQIKTADEAVALINDGAHIALGGFVGAVVPEALSRALGKRFEQTGHPSNLTIYYAAGQGDGKDRANNHFAHEGMLDTVVGGHWGLVPKLQKLAVEGKVKGYNFPQGIIAHLLRDSAAGKPGTISPIGLGTFVDPRIEGGKINSITTKDLVSVIEIKGKEYLFYDRIDANVALIRGTTADTDGNISMEDECLFVENLAAAQCARNNGGIVIVQVKRLVKKGEIPPQHVRIPGIFVDVVVVVEDENLHMQTFAEAFNPIYCGRGTHGEITKKPPRQLDAKKIIARRAALELKKGAILNYGIGAPEVIAEVTDEENVTSQVIATVEPGAIGGTPAGGLSFGASAWPDAIITQDQMFDFYDGGGIDQAFLGLAECDIKGDLNVSKFGTKIAGCGGFINITQSAKEVFFCGTFTAGKMVIETGHGELKIVTDGQVKKFINKVQQITFSGKQALAANKPVLYITERAVFSLTPQGLELIEIAPGIDLQTEVLDQMEFKPIISANLKRMDSRIFTDKSMQLMLKQ